MFVWTARINSYPTDHSCLWPSSSLLLFPPSTARGLHVLRLTAQTAKQHAASYTTPRHFTFCQRVLQAARLVSERRRWRLSFASSGLFGGDSPLLTWDKRLSEPILRPVSYPALCEYRLMRDTCSRWASAASGGGTLKDNCLFCVSWTLKKKRNHQRSECLAFSDCFFFSSSR